MSEENIEEQDEQIVHSGDGKQVVKVDFKGDSKKGGFSFHIKTYESLSAAVEDITEDRVLDLINTAASAQQRSRAANSLPTFVGEDAAERREAAWTKLLEEGKNELITEAEALNWVPGVREVSLTTAVSRYLKAMKALREAKENDEDESTLRELANEAKRLKEAKQAAEAKQANDDDLLDDILG